MSNLLNAHTQWASRPRDQRFHSLEELHEFCDHRRNVTWQSEQSLVDMIPYVRDVRGESVLTLRSNVGVNVIPTHWAFGQYARAVGAPPSYLATLPPYVAVDCLREGLTKVGSNGGLNVRAMGSPVLDDGQDEQTNQLRAVTSMTYGRIWDADVVERVQRIITLSNGKFHPPRAFVTDERGFGGVTGGTEVSGLFASDRDVFMFLIDGGSFLEGGGNDQLNRGFIVTNSEVGSAALTIMTCLFRGVCGNLIIWGAQDVNISRIRHSVRAGLRFDNQAYPALMEFANASARPVESMIARAKGMILPWVATGLTHSEQGQRQSEFAKANQFTLIELRGGIQEANLREGQCVSVWDLVQGLTRMSQSLAFTDARISLDKRAGKLLPCE